MKRFFNNSKWLLALIILPILFGACHPPLKKSQTKPFLKKSGVSPVQLSPEYKNEAYFLLPAPDSKQKRELRDLLTAVLMDRDLIEARGTELEKSSRLLLKSRRKKVFQDFCALKPELRHSMTTAWTQQSQIQFKLWLNIRKRYEASLAYHLKNRMKPENLEELLNRRELVKSLMEERQNLIVQSWKLWLSNLSRAPHSQVCKPDHMLKNIPGERLYLPYYLSLYRFFLLLPPSERTRLILAMESRK